MDCVLIALVASFAMVTIVLCFFRAHSPTEKLHERLIVYHYDGYEIEPAEVPPFEPTWRNEQLKNLSAVDLKHQNSKDGSRP
jgi:hypothetical protein